MPASLCCCRGGGDRAANRPAALALVVPAAALMTTPCWHTRSPLTWWMPSCRHLCSRLVAGLRCAPRGGPPCAHDLRRCGWPPGFPVDSKLPGLPMLCQVLVALMLAHGVPPQAHKPTVSVVTNKSNKKNNAPMQVTAKLDELAPRSAAAAPANGAAAPPADGEQQMDTDEQPGGAAAAGDGTGAAAEDASPFAQRLALFKARGAAAALTGWSGFLVHPWPATPLLLTSLPEGPPACPAPGAAGWCAAMHSACPSPCHLHTALAGLQGLSWSGSSSWAPAPPIAPQQYPPHPTPPPCRAC